MSNPDVTALIGKHIRHLRSRVGLSLEKLAEQSCLSVGFLSEVERGRKLPSLDTLVKLSRSLQVRVRDLIAPLDDGHETRVSKSEMLVRLQQSLREHYSEEEASELLRLVRSHHTEPGS